MNIEKERFLKNFFRKVHHAAARRKKSITQTAKGFPFAVCGWRYIFSGDVWALLLCTYILLYEY